MISISKTANYYGSGSGAQVVSLDSFSGWTIYKANLTTPLASSDSPNGFSVDVSDFGFINTTPNTYHIHADFTVEFSDETQAANFYDEPMFIEVRIYGTTKYRNIFGTTVFSDGDNPVYSGVSQPIGTYILQVAPPRESSVHSSVYSETGELDVSWQNFEWVIQDTKPAGDFNDAAIDYAELAQLVVEWGDGETESYDIDLANPSVPQTTFDAPLVTHHFNEPEEGVPIVNNFYVVDVYGRKSYSLEFNITPPPNARNPMIVHPSGFLLSAAKSSTESVIERRTGGITTKETVGTISSMIPISLERQEKNGWLYFLGKNDFGSFFFRSKNDGANWQQMGQAFDNTYKTHDMEVLEPSGIKLTVATKEGLAYSRISLDEGVTWEAPIGFSPYTMPTGFKTGTLRQKSKLGKETVIFSDNSTFQIEITETGAVWTAVE